MNIQELLCHTELPQLHEAVRKASDDSILDITSAVCETMDRAGFAGRLKQGSKVALGVGSRGIAFLPEIVRSAVRWFVGIGARPFIIPCMGSHGGGTAAGQEHVLRHLGIIPETVGCPVVSSMDVREVAVLLPEKLPVFMDAEAYGADAVFVINRVKPHTAFSGPHESGLVKMLSIGLGKHKGAESCHALGFGVFADIMPRMADLMLKNCPHILGGLAVIENSYDRVCRIEAVTREHLLDRDKELLIEARARMGSLPTDRIDALLIQQMGKNISGGGMDPNITGRAPSPYKTGGPRVNKIAVLRLTPESNGNATGMGAADITTQQLADSVDHEATYANVITSTVLRSGCMPVVMQTDEDAIRCLVKTCNAQGNVRMVMIKDTLSLDRLYVSSAVAEELVEKNDYSIESKAVNFEFDDEGRLVSPFF